LPPGTTALNSSKRSWPTSFTNSRFVFGSMSKLKGLRNPAAMIARYFPCVAALRPRMNAGLSGGTDPSALMRRILPK
jgi:hypothetical protein